VGKIGLRFKNLLHQKNKALIPFFTAFYPSQVLFKELLLRSDDEGVDFIEIGIPFSDPLADGKMIQYSSQKVLKAGFDFSYFLEEITQFKGRLSASLILMSYFNPILQRGIEKFAKEMKRANIEGVIVPNLPPEESGSLRKALSSHEIDLIYLIAPTTHSRRIEEISRLSDGFIYLVSLTGVTGMRKRLPLNLAQYISRVKAITSKPICVGFGISNPYQAKKVAELADGVIVGSALIHLIKEREKEQNLSQEVGNFLKDLRRMI